MKKSRLGVISLSLSILGMVLLFTAIEFEILKATAWHILLAAFEASVVGGIADWFAVRALFQKIPIPILGRHTNILLKSREKLSNGIVDLVTNQWLSKEMIMEKLAKVEVSKKLISFLDKQDNKDKVFHFLDDGILKIIDNLPEETLADHIEKILKKEVASLDIASPLGKWMEKSIHHGDHHQLWEALLDTAYKTINSSETRIVLLDNIEQQARNYRSESSLKNMLLGAADVFGGFDKESIVDKLIASVNDFVEEAKYNPRQAVRLKFDREMIQFSQDLIQGKESSLELISDFQQRIIQNIESKEIIQNLLKGFKSSAKKELSDKQSKFSIMLREYFDKAILGLSDNTELLAKIDHLFKDLTAKTIDEFHPKIGLVVKESLDKLENEELVRQIEDKVGEDLQYIRLNGAIVGGIVGGLIALLKYIIIT